MHTCATRPRGVKSHPLIIEKFGKHHANICGYSDNQGKFKCEKGFPRRINSNSYFCHDKLFSKLCHFHKYNNTFTINTISNFTNPEGRCQYFFLGKLWKVYSSNLSTTFKLWGTFFNKHQLIHRCMFSTHWGLVTPKTGCALFHVMTSLIA